MRAGGIWPTRRHLVVAVGDTIAVRAPRTTDGWIDLSEFLASVPDLEVVLPGPLCAVDPVVEHLRLQRVPVWIASADVVDAVAHIAGVRMRAANTLARALARMLERAPLRLMLHSHNQPTDPRQLHLI